MVFVDPCPGNTVRPVLVDAPEVTLYGYGALTAFNVVPTADEHERNGIVWKSLACTGGIASWDDNCDTGELLPKDPTTGELDNIIQACPFTLYSRLDCKTTTIDALQGETERVFDMFEQRGIEDEVWTRLIATTDADVLNVSSLPADAFSFLAGVAALESAIAGCYPGVATLHGDRGLAAYAAANFLLEKQGGSAFTPLGSRWAFYGGAPGTSPAGVAAPVGYAWLYATSRITLRMFEKMSPEPVMRLVRDEATGLITNEPFTLVERTYLPSRECCVFATLVIVD